MASPNGDVKGGIATVHSSKGLLYFGGAKMELTLEDLIDLIEIIAKRQSDGHLTIMKFTCGWKVMVETPNLDSGAGREEVWVLKTYPTIKDALVAAIKDSTKRII